MISNRLLASATYLKGFHCLADCGTDHGYLPIYAVSQGLVDCAVASDNKKYPLENARRNIEASYLEEDIELVLADGLPYLTSNIDIASILGMGGRSITQILEAADTSHLKRIVLSPNSESVVLRQYLMEHNWQIIAEEFLKEKGKFYTIIVAEPGPMTLSQLELEFGPHILIQRPEPFLEYLNKQINILELAIANIQDETEKQRLILRYQTLKEVLT